MAVILPFIYGILIVWINVFQVVVLKEVKFLCWAHVNEDTNACSGFISQQYSESACCSIGGQATTKMEKDSNTLAFQYRLGLKAAPCNKCIKGKCKTKNCPKNINCETCDCKQDCLVTSGKVCGSDGITYNNECELAQEKCSNQPTLEVAYLGQCKARCDGVKCLAGKSCIYDKKGVSLCIKRQCPGSCKPGKTVCGSNGKTYPSQCHLTKDSCATNKLIIVKYLGECKDDMSCSSIVCDKDQSCVTNKEGKPLCIKCCNGKGRVPLRLFDLCGTNGVIYQDWCAIKKESCRSGKLIKVDFTMKSCSK